MNRISFACKENAFYSANPDVRFLNYNSLKSVGICWMQQTQKWRVQIGYTSDSAPPLRSGYFLALSTSYIFRLLHPANATTPTYLSVRTGPTTELLLLIFWMC